MNKRLIQWAVGSVLALCAQQSFALTDAPNLVDVFNQSLANDPQWLAYKSSLMSNKENEPINLALLLPNLSVSGTSQYNNRNQRAVTPNTTPANFGVGDFNYSTNNYTIQLTQTLFNFANWEQFQAAKAGVKQATAQYGAQYQALMVQVAQDYFNILEARDVLNYTITQRQAVNQLYQQNLERYRVGLGTITDVYNAKADLDSIISQEIGAKNQLLNAIEALRAITGQTYTRLAGLRDNIPLLKPQPANVETWVSIAADQNLSVLAARYAADVSREQVKQQFAGHLPTINAVASYAELHGGNNGFGTTNEGDGAVGVQLTLPLYQGGGVVAATQQAQYNYQTALSNLQVAIRSAIQNTRTSYNNVISGVSRVKADKAAIVSNESSLESTEAAFKVGTRTIVDVLDAQTQLFNVQITYANDLYTYIISILNLKLSAGTLTPQDLAAINHWLTQNTPLTGYYESPYLDSMPQTLNAANLKNMPQPNATQQQQLKNAVQSLPVFTPQPQTPWTMPSPTTATPSVNPPNPITMPSIAPTAPSTTLPTMPNVNPANSQFVPPSLSSPTTTTPTVPAVTTPAPAAVTPPTPSNINPLEGGAPTTNSTPATTLPQPRFASPPAAPVNVAPTVTTPAAPVPTPVTPSAAPSATTPAAVTPPSSPSVQAAPAAAIPTPDFPASVQANTATTNKNSSAVTSPVTIPAPIKSAAAPVATTPAPQQTTASKAANQGTVADSNYALAAASIAQALGPAKPAVKSQDT